MLELTVTIKSTDARFSQKFLIYDKIEMVEDNPVIKECISQALNVFQIDTKEIEDIKIKTVMVVT